MAILKSVFYVIVVLTFIILGLVFSFRNQPLVNVDLLFVEIGFLSIGFWLIASLLLGVFLGLFLAFPKRLSQALKIRILSKKITANASSPPPARVKIESSKGQ